MCSIFLFFLHKLALKAKNKGFPVICYERQKYKVCMHNLILIFVLFSLITEEMVADVIACLVFHFYPRSDLGAISFASIFQKVVHTNIWCVQPFHKFDFHH